MHVRAQRWSCTGIIFRIYMANKAAHLIQCDPAPLLSSKVRTAIECYSPSSGRKQSNVVICSFPSVISSVCGILNCYYCGYQRLVGSLPHSIWALTYLVRQRTHATAEPLSWTGHFASLHGELTGILTENASHSTQFGLNLTGVMTENASYSTQFGLNLTG